MAQLNVKTRGRLPAAAPPALLDAGEYAPPPFTDRADIARAEDCGPFSIRFTVSAYLQPTLAEDTP